jgi:acetolactate synthase-1/2/3 large subunit
VRKGHGGQIRKALQLLMTAKRRPHLYRRRVLSNASQGCALWWTCSVTLHRHLMGLGVSLQRQKKFLGMLGMHGTEANQRHAKLRCAAGCGRPFTMTA